MPLIIDPAHYEAASQCLGQDVADALTDAYRYLAEGLRGSGAMAGTDDPGAKFAASYQTAASGAANAILESHTAASKLAVLLQATGFNHSFAEDHSNALLRSGLGDTTRYDTSGAYRSQDHGVLYSPCSDIPEAYGGEDNSPTGWGIIESAVKKLGYVWTNGHQDRLRRAKEAWSGAASRLYLAAAGIDEAVVTVGLQTSPEVADVQTVLNGFHSSIDSLADQCVAISQQCEQYASIIDTVHDAVVGCINGILAASIVTQAAGLFASIFTLGTAEGPTQIAEGTEVAATAAVAADYIATFETEAGTIALGVSGIDSEVLAVGRAIAPIMSAEVQTAETVLVTGLPTATITDAESLALARVEVAGSKVWGLGWQARGLDIEMQLGGNLPKAFPVVDEAENGVVASIKSIDTTAPTYQNAGRFESKVRGYIDKVSKFDGATFNGREIDADDIGGRVLKLAVPADGATPGQVAVLDRMAAYAKTRIPPVSLQIVQVP